MMIDTHCHIYSSEIKNAEEIIKEAGKSDIHMIANGTDLSSNTEVLDLSERYNNVHAALGYFYTLADEITEDDICLLDTQIGSNKITAVGEIGLDYYIRKDNKDKQKELFEKMLELCEKHNLPAIIHSRKAMQDTFDIVKNYDVCGSLHSFQGSVEMAREFIKLGFYIGVGGSITHKNNKKTQKLVKEIDIGNILVETDSPYMSPEEKRGEINTPLNLKFITNKLSEVLEISEDKVVEVTTENAKSLFKTDFM